MASNISEEEIQQLLRTVEMFEAITQSQPEDYQSLEILKEAYNKLGRQVDSVRISRKLASVYVTQGQISQAILEYEGILQECPDDANAAAALAELEAKTSKINVAHPSAAPSLAEDSKPTPPAGVPAGAPASADLDEIASRGDRVLADVLISEKLITPQAAEPLLQKLKTLRSSATDKSQLPSLCQLLASEQIIKMEDVLAILCDKSGLPYLPLAIYDVDRDIACLLPQELCWKLCVVPFDLISRSVLIATANPFDQETHQRIAVMLDYNIFWYVTAPAEIAVALQRAYGLGAGRTQLAKS
jgi:tetratricopeptide (TPR) repeat protein